MKNLLQFLFLLSCNLAIADTWSQKLSLTGAREGTVGFSIGSKGYIGTGYNGGAMFYYKDFWEYNPDSNVWTQKADFGGDYRSGAVAFSIGQKGYIGLGVHPISGLKNDFWEWDQASNTWSQKAAFGGTARWIAAGFSIGTKGYVGTGDISGGSTGTKDFWEWDGDTSSVNYNTWTQKADFAGIARSHAIGFSIGAKGYIGTGKDAALNLYSDFWEWNQQTNTWVQRADYGGGVRQGAAAFSIAMKGYIGTGTSGSNTKDFWEWDGDSLSATYNIWTRKADFGGVHRWASTGFSIGNRGYIGMGFFFSVSTNDFWEYCDTCSSTGIEELNNFQFSFYPNPATNKIFISTKQSSRETTMELFNQSCQLVLQKTFASLQSKTEINLPALTNGIYFLKIQSDKNSSTQKIIIQN